MTVRIALAAALLTTALTACKREHPRASPAVETTSTARPNEAALAALRAFDASARKKALALPPAPSSDSLGSNPYRVSALPGGRLLAGILRGADEVVVLDGDLATLGRAPAPDVPSALAVSAGGEIFVAGELSSQIRVYGWDGALEQKWALDLGDVRGIRDLELSGRTLHVVEEHDGRLITIQLPRDAARRGLFEIGPGAPGRSERVVGKGSFGVRRVGAELWVHALLEHALIGFEIDAQGRPARELFRVVHDGPIWAFDALPGEDETWALVGGVEDHPLDRRDGVFGHVDSFVYLYRIGADHAVERVRAVNTSSLGVVTPKVIELSRDADGTLLATVTGYGSARQLELRFDRGVRAEPSVEALPFVPGTSAMAKLADGTRVFASPLFDAWIRSQRGAPKIVEVPEAANERTALSKLGEALFFTTSMSPWNRSDGRLSRFTCETCHFEGYVDGRVHYTGRADHHVTTKPLLGLYNNRPYFSRALDPDLGTVSHHEFRVAVRGNGYDPWFSIRRDEFPWLERLGIASAEIEPLELRKALVSFLTEFTHAPNPMAFGRSSFLTDEARGAELFRERCARCHAPRMAADEPGSEVPFERWEELIFSLNAPLVWARADYEKSGVLPYLHERGTRVPSLRRLYKKWPYFTNGSAKSLNEVLERARWDADRFYHDVAPPEGALRSFSAEERAALLAFLRLL